MADNEQEVDEAEGMRVVRGGGAFVCWGMRRGGAWGHVWGWYVGAEGMLACVGLANVFVPLRC